MPTDKGIAEVEELKTLLGEANLIISTDYRGLNVTEMSALRRAVREGGGTYRVAKNTLVKIASEAIDRPEIVEIVVGPTGFVLSTDDPVGPTRALMTHIEQNRLEVVINGAYLEGRIVDADRVKYLATLPGREELVARVLGQMNAPIVNLVSVLNGTLRGFMTVLQAHIDKVGSAAVADEAEASSEETVAVEAEAAAAPGEQAEGSAEEPAAQAAEDEEPSGEAAEGPVTETETPEAESPEAEIPEEGPSDQTEAPAAEAAVEEDPSEEAAEEPEAEADASEDAPKEEQTPEAEASEQPEDLPEETAAEEELGPETSDPDAPDTEDNEDNGEASEDKPAE